jgi:hypothetical protein
MSYRCAMQKVPHAVASGSVTGCADRERFDNLAVEHSVGYVAAMRLRTFRVSETPL